MPSFSSILLMSTCIMRTPTDPTSPEGVRVMFPAWFASQYAAEAAVPSTMADMGFCFAMLASSAAVSGSPVSSPP